MTTKKETGHLSEYLALLQRDALKLTGDIKNAEINREKWLKQTSDVIEKMKKELDAMNATIDEIMSLLEKEGEDDAEGIPAGGE